jgi:glucokinase
MAKPDSGAVIGVDLGGTTVSAGLVTDDGAVLFAVQHTTRGDGSASALDTVFTLIDRCRDTARARGLSVAGVGIGVAGTVDAETGAVGAEAHYVPELAGQPLGALVTSRAGVPAFVDNDVNAQALGEWTWGEGQGAHSVVVLALGTGVGGGIVLGGRLHRGSGGYGGELGHVPIAFEGRPCICGGRGCLKAYVSGTDIAREGQLRLRRDVGAEEVFRLAAAGEPTAGAIVDEVITALGAGLAVIVNGLNPECLLLTGSVARSLRPLTARVLDGVGRYAFAGALRTTRIAILERDKDATVRGGAALYRYESARRADGRPRKRSV